MYTILNWINLSYQDSKNKKKKEPTSKIYIHNPTNVRNNNILKLQLIYNRKKECKYNKWASF